MIASMSQAAPHIWTGMIAFVCGPMACAKGLRGDRDALVDVDDHRNGADRQHGRRGRHIGVGGNDDFVAWADAHRGQACRQSERPAGRKSEMADAEIGRVSLLKRRALALFAVPKQLARPDDPGDRLDLLLADDIHARQLLAGLEPSLAEVRGGESANRRLLPGATFYWRSRILDHGKPFGAAQIDSVGSRPAHRLHKSPRRRRKRLRAAQRHRKGSWQRSANQRGWVTKPSNSLIPVR